MRGGTDTPGPRNRSINLPQLEDINSDPNIVEVNLEAAVTRKEFVPGVPVEVWAYNGQVPGPLLAAKVGDRVIVHFTNSLPEPTTIHWHGVRVPANMDGTATMQDPVQPGQTFTYSFDVSDAALFWYHPHIRSDFQVEKGLYGPLVVRSPQEPTTTAEQILVLDDIRLNSDGMLDDSSQNMGNMNMDDMMGREGNVLLVNGVANAEIALRPGGLYRWRIVNSAPARYFRLALPSHTLWQIGTDGGPIEKPYAREEILLAPGERADIMVQATASADQTFELQAMPYERGHATAMADSMPLMHVVYEGEAVQNAPTLPTTLGVVSLLPEAPTVRLFRLSEDNETPMDTGTGNEHGTHMMAASTMPDMEMTGMMRPVFRINGEAFPDITPIVSSRDTIETWQIINETVMDHPFHLHGFFFQTSVDGTPDGPLAWKDTVNIPAQTTVSLNVLFDGYTGSWMYHCHILAHAELGMMGELKINP